MRGSVFPMSPWWSGVEYHYQYHCVRVPSLGGNWKSTRPLINDILPSFESVILIALATVLQSPSACTCRQDQRHLWWGWGPAWCTSQLFSGLLTALVDGNPRLWQHGMLYYNYMSVKAVGVNCAPCGGTVWCFWMQSHWYCLPSQILLVLWAPWCRSFTSGHKVFCTAHSLKGLAWSE